MTMQAIASGEREMRLDGAAIDALASGGQPMPLPDALEVIATIAAPTTDDIDAGEFRVLIQSVAGAPGVRLLGRFCHADPTLHAVVADHLRREESLRPDAVFAEVVHLPEGRLGNILCRPVLRSHEISYLGRSGAAPDRQIPITDLLVSARGARVVLRSERLNREVIPRLTTAHNYDFRSLGVYRFLCALQSQHVVRGLRWSWGPLAGAPFLPRVTVGRAVLARARWTLTGAALALVSTDDLPRYVALVDGDNELVCDLTSARSVDALRHQLRGRAEATLVEVFPAPNELCVTGPEGRFTHEVIVPFLSRSTTTAFGDGFPVRPRVRRGLPPPTGCSSTRCGRDAGSRRAPSGPTSSFTPTARPSSAFYTRSPRRLLADGRLWRVQLDTYERRATGPAAAGHLRTGWAWIVRSACRAAEGRRGRAEESPTPTRQASPLSNSAPVAHDDPRKRPARQPGSPTEGTR